VLAALCLSVLAACGDDDDAAAPVDATTSAAGVTTAATTVDAAGGTYEGELRDGSRLVVHLDVPADHPAVVPFEEFRAYTEADEPTWIVAEITPPEDLDGTGRFLVFLEAGADPLDDDPADPTDGITNSDFACAAIEDWFRQAFNKDQALNDAYMKVYDGPCDGEAFQVLAPAGETTTYVMVYEGDLPDFEVLQAELGTELTPV
jgi:hypothetical protein